MSIATKITSLFLSRHHSKFQPYANRVSAPIIGNWNCFEPTTTPRERHYPTSGTRLATTLPFAQHSRYLSGPDASENQTRMLSPSDEVRTMLLKKYRWKPAGEKKASRQRIERDAAVVDDGYETDYGRILEWLGGQVVGEKAKIMELFGYPILALVEASTRHKDADWGWNAGDSTRL